MDLKLSRAHTVAPTIIFFSWATWGASMAVRVSRPIKFDGWARDRISSVMFVNRSLGGDLNGARRDTLRRGLAASFAFALAAADTRQPWRTLHDQNLTIRH